MAAGHTRYVRYIALALFVRRLIHSCPMGFDAHDGLRCHLLTRPL